MPTYIEPDKAFKIYGQALNQISKYSYPLVARSTLNSLAFESRMRLSTVEMPKKFILRNTFENKKSLHTERSANTLDINAMESSMGQMAVVNFQRGPRPTEDLKIQEKGGLIRARDGNGRVRIPAKAARVGGDFRKVTAKQNRPARGDNWPSLDDIERKIGFKNGAKNPKSLPLKKRIRRAHVIMAKKRVNLGFDAKTKYIVPSMSAPGSKWNVYGFLGKKKSSTRLHSLQTAPKKVKKRETVKPAFMHILNHRAEQIFVQEANRRLTKTAMRRLGFK